MRTIKDCSLPMPHFALNCLRARALCFGRWVKMHGKLVTGFDDMILGCRFEESDCKEDDFILFPFPSFFNCFTFVRGRKEKLITTNGLRAALSITMYLEPEDPGISQSYSNKPHFANNVGVRILITPPNYLAAIGNYGHEFSPGLTTSIGFDITKHIRLSEPYSTCRSTESMKLERCRVLIC